jgi:hypothetical protein
VTPCQLVRLANRIAWALGFLSLLVLPALVVAAATEPATTGAETMPLAGQIELALESSRLPVKSSCHGQMVSRFLHNPWADSDGSTDEADIFRDGERFDVSLLHSKRSGTHLQPDSKSRAIWTGTLFVHRQQALGAPSRVSVGAMFRAPAAGSAAAVFDPALDAFWGLDAKPMPAMLAAAGTAVIVGGGGRRR